MPRAVCCECSRSLWEVSLAANWPGLFENYIYCFLVIFNTYSGLIVWRNCFKSPLEANSITNISWRRVNYPFNVIQTGHCYSQFSHVQLLHKARLHLGAWTGPLWLLPVGTWLCQSLWHSSSESWQPLPWFLWGETTPPGSLFQTVHPLSDHSSYNYLTNKLNVVLTQIIPQQLVKFDIHKLRFYNNLA